MDDLTREHLRNLDTTDRERQNQAFAFALAATDVPVGWAYEVWDDLVALLRHPDNHQRAIGAQVLCNLAKSDPENRMARDFPALLAVTKDPRFVTARHCLQSLWKVGAAGEEQRRQVVAGLSSRFKECETEKNGTLIRYDIQQALRTLCDHAGDAGIKTVALGLIELEADPKYRKKYATVWRAR